MDNNQDISSVDFSKAGEGIIILTQRWKTGNTDIITFNSETFAPVRNEQQGENTRIWNITEVEKGERGQPSFRHTVELNTQQPGKKDSYTDYPKEVYGKVYDTWYDAIDGAIDRLDNGTQKELIRRHFDKAARELGYQPIEKGRKHDI